MPILRRLAPLGAAAAVTALATTVALVAQAPASKPRDASGPPDQAKAKPVDHLPNPYETIRDWGATPQAAAITSCT